MQRATEVSEAASSIDFSSVDGAEASASSADSTTLTCLKDGEVVAYTEDSYELYTYQEVIEKTGHTPSAVHAKAVFTNRSHSQG